MARGHNNGITILLGVKDLKIGEVIEYEDRIVVKASLCPIIPVKIEKWMAIVVKYILWKF